LCVCTVTDFSAEDKASGVTFRTVVHRRPGHGISHFGEVCSSRSPKSDESASHREVEFTMGTPTAKVTLEMRRSWNMARRVDVSVGMCGYTPPTYLPHLCTCYYYARQLRREWEGACPQYLILPGIYALGNPFDIEPSFSRVYYMVKVNMNDGV